MNKTLPPNAHTADDFYLGENKHLPIKTQTLMWYLKKFRDSIKNNIEIGETGKDWIWQYDTDAERLKHIIGNSKETIRMFTALIERLEADQERKISHIRKALHE